MIGSKAPFSSRFFTAFKKRHFIEESYAVALTNNRIVGRRFAAECVVAWGKLCEMVEALNEHPLTEKHIWNLDEVFCLLVCQP